MTLGTEPSLSQVTERELNYVTARAELDHLLALAADALLSDYLYDKELDVFTILDTEDFCTDE